MSLLSPLGLLAGLLGGPILAMYFLKLRRRKVRVPSTLLWTMVDRQERTASPFDRFRRNLLLLLQLLLLLLLTLALARPAFETEAALRASVVIVVDTSASMSATDMNGTRLQAAIDAAEQVIDDLSQEDEAMVVVAGPRTDVRVPFTRDKSALRSGLGTILETQAEGHLYEGLQLALSMAQSRDDVSVVVFSDGGGGDLSELSTGGTEVRLVPVGVSSQNLGITAVDLRRAPASDLDRQLFVTVQNFGSIEQTASVEVTLSGKVAGVRSEPVPPGEVASMVFAVSGLASGKIHVTLRAEQDHLAADNHAWALVDAVDEHRVALVGGDWLTARVLGSDPRVALEIVPRGGYTPDLLTRTDAILFGDAVPEGLDGFDYAVLGPLPGSPVTFGDAVPAPQVLGWRRTHPLLRFVEWSGVRVGKSFQVSDGGGLVPLVDSDGGGLVWAGERGGGRVVQLAFDPMASDLPLRVAWPVFVLNTVGWLTDDSGGSGAEQVPAGHPWSLRLPEGITSARVRGPDGTDVSAQIQDGLLRVRDTEQVGVYEVSAGSVQTAFVANLLSRRESDIAPRGQLQLAPTMDAPEGEQAGVALQEIWRPLGLIALLLLLIEWAFWNRRRFA